MAGFGPIDADPVSVLLVSHLDRIYAEMGRLCVGRTGDPHRWINPDYNGGRPLSYPQPAGIAVTDPNQQFVGWHAIAILRVAQDQAGKMRVFFYNPNNDSGQDWGGGVLVSTSGNGERYGEASLELERFLSRVYLFHEDPLRGDAGAQDIPDSAIKPIRERATSSWASDRIPD